MQKYILTLIFFLLVPSLALALDWSQASDLAEKNSNTLKSAKKQLESTQWSYNKALTSFLPQLSASAGISGSLTSASSETYSYGLSASQTLFNGLDNYYSAKLAQVNVDSAKASLQDTYANVYYDLRVDFLELLFARKNIVLLEGILKTREKNTGLIQLRYESGREDKGNLLGTKADDRQAQYNLNTAKNDLVLAKLKLAQTLGVDIDTVEETIKTAGPSTADFDQLLKASPDYLIAVSQLETAKIQQASSVSGFLPSVSLSASYTKQGQQWPPADSSSKSWRLSVSYPFFPGGSNFVETLIAKAELDQAKEDYDKAVKDLRYNLEKAYADYKDAIDALESEQVSLAANKEKAEIANVKYLNGLVTYDEWNRLENAYIQSQKSVLSAQKSALLAEANWHKTYGGKVR